MANSFEAKLHGFRRTQDGVVISYVVHPSDLSSDMALAALGTRYMVAFEELGDDERPIERRAAIVNSPAYKADQKARTDQARSALDGVAKQRKSFDSLPLVQQCAIRCGDAQFAMFLMDKYSEASAMYHDTSDVVRELCSIESRKELETNEDAGRCWKHMESKYQQWLTDKRYADSAR